MLIGIIIFIIFRMTSMSDVISLLTDYAKVNILITNELVNIKNEPIKEIKSNDDVKGLWKSEGIAFEKRYEALIDNESIIIYKYDGDRKNIYWLGTFDFGNSLIESIDENKVNETSNSSLNSNAQSSIDLIVSEDIINNNSNKKHNKYNSGVITSKNYKQISKYLPMASQKENMDFVYNDGTIIFMSQYNDDLYEVKLRPYTAYNDRLRMIKYNNDRKGEYNEITNKEITLNNYKISYPNYFDVEEENSRRNIPDNWVYNVNDSMKEKNLIILSPSNTKSFAEFFVGEYENANIESFEELKDYIVYNNEHYSIDDSELVTYAFDNKSSSVMQIFSTKYYDEYNGKVIYSLAFENWILMKDTNEIINIGVSYTNDDTSEYDYISDYENIIKNIRRIQ